MGPPIIDSKSEHVDEAAIKRLGVHIQAQLEALASEALAPGLYLVATPIGNLADISVRALDVLMRADIVYAEDTRTSRVLLQKYGIKTALKSYHEHSAERVRDTILKSLSDGMRVALISDAGTPLVSDPGFKLVRNAVSDGHQVFSLPGASASLAALTVAGLPTDCFLFLGFLPNKSGERRSRLEAIKNLSATLLFFEVPTRLEPMLSDLLEVLGARDVVIARELTKRHEEVRRGELDKFSELLEGMTLKGECVVVVGPAVGREVSDEEIIASLGEVLKHESLRDAAKRVASAFGVQKTRVYELGLAIKDAKR